MIIIVYHMISMQFNSFYATMGRSPWVQWLYSPHRLDRVPIWLWKSSSGMGNQTTHRRTSAHEVLRQKTHKQELEYWLFLLRCFSDPCRYRRYLYYQGNQQTTGGTVEAAATPFGWYQISRHTIWYSSNGNGSDISRVIVHRMLPSMMITMMMMMPEYVWLTWPGGLVEGSRPSNKN